MSPLAKSTIATVGSGVMAEAMIAGMLRGALVEPGQVVASHPRPERREHLEREYGIRTVASNVEAVDGADVILLGIKPQMLAKVGREIGPHLRRGQLVLSVLAGATTGALVGILGHDQVVRSMPNTPARLGKGMTVWYATPATTEAQRGQAAALLGALGHQLEVDDEKMVAMATAVSGTGPTYVFLFMEALIDAAVHLGFPRHIAHDLVIETLEGSTVFAKQSGMHPAELRNMVTSPGGHLRGGAPRARVRPTPDGALRGGLGGLSPDGRARRPARSVRRSRSRAAEGRLTATPDTDASEGLTNDLDLRRVPLSSIRGRDLRAPGRDFWADEVALWDRMTMSWTGLDDAAWHLPGAAPSDAGGPTWSLAEHVGHIADWQELATAYTTRVIETGEWPSDSDYGDFDTFNERRREPWASMPRDALLGRLEAARPRLLEVASRLSPEQLRGDDGWRWVFAALHGHYLDHLAVIEPWTADLRRSGVAG